MRKLNFSILKYSLLQKILLNDSLNRSKAIKETICIKGKLFSKGKIFLNSVTLSV